MLRLRNTLKCVVTITSYLLVSKSVPMGEYHIKIIDYQVCRVYY